ncbi:MAG: hypothetical protein A2Y15_04855 [Clostridiales bacterium GWF2_36_10]|nr:MAG: hypothetical protein A2Y15_04855 [Clostridiales bacterium GWF2_36_10]HAN20836.1 hypothetical protein [Clostridiales bacterium]
MFIYRISLQYEITKAQLLIKTTPPEVKVDTEKKGYEMDSHPIKIQIDNKEFLESIGIKSINKVLEEKAEYGKQAVLKSMARYTEDKNAMLGPDGLTVSEIAAQRSFKTISSTLKFIPENQPEISWKDGYVDINYTKDERNVKYIPSQMEFEYIPYSVKFIVKKHMEEVSKTVNEND